jgi:glutamate N-acetyltransferase/amino-acid N-acetyltransferase
VKKQPLSRFHQEIIPMPDFTLLSPQGFCAAGVACGLKTKAGAPDLGLLVADRPVAAAAMFTTNKVVAPPVVLDRQTIRSGRIRAVVVNSGNANACTGKQGMKDARTMARLAAEGIGAKADEVLVSSTGIIGHFLPMDKISRGIAAASAKLDATPAAAESFARAIMTTDLAIKMCGAQKKIGSQKVIVAGACKGSGMIAPNMATMLAYLTTDANIGPAALKAALKAAVDVSFNAITVDGHSSTNDSVIILASGASGGKEIRPGTREFKAFAELLCGVCRELALKIVRDGEGATKLVEILITGAASAKDAQLAARAVANSPLVKCAINGGDPNWGRVVSAVGYSGAKMDEAKLRHWIDDELVFAKGLPTDFDRAKCEAHMKGDHVVLRVDLAMGRASTTCWTCDLSKEYVSINADYHT